MLKSRLSELSRQYGFSYNQAFIRNQRTRWGSCSHKNNINLNISLARLRPELDGLRDPARAAAHADQEPRPDILERTG